MTEPKKAKPTDYVVLRKAIVETLEGAPIADAAPDRFEIVGRVSANGEKQAKKLVFTEMAKGREGEITETLIAVPARSFQPEQLRVVNQPRIVFG